MVKIHINFHSILLGQRKGQKMTHNKSFSSQNPKLFILIHQAPPFLSPRMNMTASYFPYPTQYNQYQRKYYNQSKGWVKNMVVNNNIIY